METPKIGETISKEQFNKLFPIGTTISAEHFSSVYGKQEQSKTPFVEKVGDFMGITPIAKGLSAMAFKYLTPEGKELEKKVNNNTATPEELQAYSEIYGNLPNAKQIAGGAAKTALTLGTLGTGGVATNLAGRVIEGGILGGAYTALDNMQNNEKATKNLATGVAIGGAIPLAGTVIKKGIQGVGKVLKFGGEKIQQIFIKPTMADIEDGFKIENINKYGLGGSLETTLKKTEKKLEDLSKQLSSKLASRPETSIDLNEVAKKTATNILSNKSKSFGDLGSVKNILEKLGSEIEEVSANGLVDLPEAQAIKQAAGKKGAWVFGFRDPDAKATEIVYNKFYRVLKEEIEKKAPQGVKEINKQIGELIPISHAVIRRIPVAERNNVLSLTDLITGGFAIGFDKKAIGLFIANRLTKSGWVGKMLAQTGKKVSEIKMPSGNLGQRIFGR
jgi:hypothetical protein